jgi:hypothetical protein
MQKYNIDDIRSSQETLLRASTVCYGDSFTSSYVDGVHTSQETHLWATTTCYGDSFTFCLLEPNLLSRVIVSSPTCYEMVCQRKRLTPSSMNNRHKWLILNNILHNEC